jgi:hypothetical protein
MTEARLNGYVEQKNRAAAVQHRGAVRRVRRADALSATNS